jgi:hypothetical protein
MLGHAHQLKSARCRLAGWIASTWPVRSRLWAIRLIATLRRPVVAVGGRAAGAQRERNSCASPWRDVTSSGFRPRAIGESFDRLPVDAFDLAQAAVTAGRSLHRPGTGRLPGRDAPAAHDARHIRHSICLTRRASWATFTASAGASLFLQAGIFATTRVSGSGAAFSIGGCLRLVGPRRLTAV